MATFAPSIYQQAIFDWIKDGQGNAIVNAVAGSGKTTTLTQAAKLLIEPGIFLAFNKHIVEELSARMAGTPMIVKTIHSVGNAMVSAHLGKVKIEGDKYKVLIEEALANLRAEDKIDQEEHNEAKDALTKLVNLARLTLTDPKDSAMLGGLCIHYGIELNDATDAAFDAVAKVLEAGQRQARLNKVIDFTDMIWLPCVWNLQTKRVKWVMVDECQDLSAAQLEVAMKCLDPQGRFLAVGDPRQSIMGFAGADNQSFAKIKARTQATELPLSICYRCPPNHLLLAKQVVPTIEPIPGREDGVLQTFCDWSKGEATWDILKLVQEGDLIICRLTAPLVSTCIKLIEKKIPARVKGRDIGKDLIGIIKKVQTRFKNDFTYAKIIEFMQAWEQEQLAFLRQKPNSEAQVESLQDRVNALETCIQSFGATSLDGLYAEIEGLFADEKAGVTLATVHRTKGLEAERVFVIRSNKLPLTWKNQQPWEAEQEMNLYYVAVTRSKRELHIGAEDGLFTIPQPESDELPQPVEIAPITPEPVAEQPAPLQSVEAEPIAAAMPSDPVPVEPQALEIPTKEHQPDLFYRGADAVMEYCRTAAPTSDEPGVWFKRKGKGRWLLVLNNLTRRELDSGKSEFGKYSALSPLGEEILAARATTPQGGEGQQMLPIAEPPAATFGRFEHQMTMLELQQYVGKLMQKHGVNTPIKVVIELQ